MADITFPPSLPKQLNDQNTFTTREVGITHPDTPAFIRLTDKGDIEIMAADGLGIIINREHNSITIMANTIRFMTTDNEGLAWNNNFFNSQATVYSQPALNPATGVNIHNVFRGAEHFYNNSVTAGTTFVAGEQLPGFTGNPAEVNHSQDLAQIHNIPGSNTALTSANPNDNQPVQ